jgi:hypothetical protein
MRSRGYLPLGSTLSLLSLTFVILFFPAVLEAGGRRRAVAVSPTFDELELTFIENALPEATIDAGVVSWDGETSKGASTRRQFAVRIGRPSGEARGTATLRAFLETTGTRCNVSIDGIPLGHVPRIIHANAPIGITTKHKIEIHVPTDAPAGTFDAVIRWEVTRN